MVDRHPLKVFVQAHWYLWLVAMYAIYLLTYLLTRVLTCKLYIVILINYLFNKYERYYGPGRRRNLVKI